ncbi:hypothetical protein GCM10027297_36870 [Parahaliea aestuarii]
MSRVYILPLLAFYFSILTFPHLSLAGGGEGVEIDPNELCASTEFSAPLSMYLPGALERGILCLRIGAIDKSVVSQLVENRSYFISKHDDSALNDFSMTIDTYVVSGDVFEAQIGQKLLERYLASHESADPRYLFLLGVSYLNFSCDDKSVKAVQLLERATIMGHILAPALLSYSYENPYKCIERDKVKSRDMKLKFEHTAGSNKVTYSEVIDYLKGKGLIVSGP